MSLFRMLHGDCIERLRELANNSTDSIVTDPPAGISFMGKEWDGDKGGRDAWVKWMAEVMGECLRVLKPGGHALIWALPRTSHWTATAVEDAGFEVRDVVTHLFGSGFPKSLDISKAIDKAAGAELEIVAHQAYSAPDIRGNSYDQSHVSERGKLSVPITAPTTDAAKQWSGWGTALKPASEHWILARKPCSEKTVAANVLKWGVGGLNIDGCRVEMSGDDINFRHTTDYTPKGVVNYGGGKAVGGHPESVRHNPIGRFPANLVLSHSPLCTEDACDMFDCPVAMLDEQSGTLKSGKRAAGVRKGMGFHVADGEGGHAIEASQGGASRFFYVAKPSRRERNAGCEDVGGNVHSTVKPIKLMRYLIRMVTPAGGVVLDPFTGSGTTGVAALQEGMRFIGIERDADYLKIAQARISNANREADGDLAHTV